MNKRAVSIFEGDIFESNSMEATSEPIEVTTPRHSLLSARFKHSFAFLSLNTRLPGIMLQIINTLENNKIELIDRYGEEAENDIRHIIKSIEYLKTDLNRDRQFQLFIGKEPDKEKWNAFITELPKPKKTFFRACWLHAECYLYRRIHSFFGNSKTLSEYDYFGDLKTEDLERSVKAMHTIALATRGLERKWDIFRELIQFCLYSTQYELQLNNFNIRDVKTLSDIVKIASSAHHTLVNDSILVWNSLMKYRAKTKLKKAGVIEFICDNAGFELFANFIFIDYLLDAELASVVRLHVKAIPWAISDATHNDLEFMLNFLMSSSNDLLASLGHKWMRMIQEKRIQVAPKSYFWTGPQAFFVMMDVDFELYKMLAGSHMAIFKGDLNYRKLLGDYIWDSTEEFITCLRGFRPCNICAIRTMKSEVVCGLDEGKADALTFRDPQWMTRGNYGLIQYTDSLKCSCALHDTSLSS